MRGVLRVLGRLAPWGRQLVRVVISGLTLVPFFLQITGGTRFDLIERVENFLYDTRVQLTMPATASRPMSRVLPR